MSEATLYVKCKGDDLLIVSLYVDDLLITGGNAKVVEEFKREMMLIFEMTNLRKMTYFFGMEIKQLENEFFICQNKYFHIEDCKAMSTPMNPNESLSKEDDTNKVEEGYFRSMVGCLMYLTATRTDILFTISILSRFMHCASKVDLKASKRVIR